MIEGTDDAAVVVLDTSGVEVRDLTLVGAGSVRPGSAGVWFFSDLPDGQVLGNVAVSQVEASGFVNGIEVGSEHAGNGFRDVRIEDSVVHDNRDAGVAVYGPEFDPAAPRYAHEEVSVTGVTASGNVDDPANTRRNTRSGIVRGGSVSRSVAHDNGGSGGAGEGPVGIWAYDSTGIVIEHNLSYRNRTATLTDGGGFALDQNTADSVLQYNLFYDNHGPGSLVHTGQDNDAHHGSTVRFNVSSGDAHDRRGHADGRPDRGAGQGRQPGHRRAAGSPARVAPGCSCRNREVSRRGSAVPPCLLVPQPVDVIWT
ncbi:MAG: right-handed parallel beta-helix repeat-containing protein [Pseudonocardia sp.]|nr:right-handed parallel beta-helix repeat-containing protein [Pseudonocardia sp.]